MTCLATATAAEVMIVAAAAGSCGSEHAVRDSRRLPLCCLLDEFVKEPVPVGVHRVWGETFNAPQNSATVEPSLPFLQHR